MIAIVMYITIYNSLYEEDKSMACVIVPAAEAVITTIITKEMESKEKTSETVKVQFDGGHLKTTERIQFTRKLKWLNKLLWGGSALLAFEHMWHGEIVPWFPFLTAAGNPVDTAEMLHEMTTTGVAMSALVTAVWLGIVAVTSVMEKKALKRY